MIVGLDFDNTIVCYDRLFHSVAVEQGTVPAEVERTKTAVKAYLINSEQESTWTEMQGLVYGARLIEADPYPDAINIIKLLRKKGHTVCIVSHKTKYPYLGKKYDLHNAALNWITGKVNATEELIRQNQIYLCETKDQKITKIGALNCDVFIDDLEEIFANPLFPKQTKKVLFDPAHRYSNNLDDVIVSSSWLEFGSFIDSIS